MVGEDRWKDEIRQDEEVTAWSVASFNLLTHCALATDPRVHGNERNGPWLFFFLHHIHTYQAFVELHPHCNKTTW